MRQLLVAAICLFSNLSQAETPTPTKQHLLTEAQIQAAISRGEHGRSHETGLTLNDVQTAIFSSMACKTCGQSGYTVTIYTPIKWIEEVAMEAKREMKPFTIADVTEEMKQPILRVVALPSRANYITGAGLSGASNVHRVVLTDRNKQNIIQPLSNENGSVEGNSAFRSVNYTNASSTFAMSDVDKVRGDDDGEFFVVVVGDKQNKYFKVKTRMFKKLFDEEAKK